MPAESGQFEVGLGEPGTIWVTGKKDYPTGKEDKASEVQKIFLDLQHAMHGFAKNNNLTPHAPLETESGEE